MISTTKSTACLSGTPLKRQTHLDKGNLLEGDAPIGLHHLMQGHESAEHGVHVGLPKVLPAGFLQRLVPHLMPQNGHANQLLTHLQIKVVQLHTQTTQRLSDSSYDTYQDAVLAVD